MQPLSTTCASNKANSGMASNLPYLAFSVMYIMSANIFQADRIKTTGLHWKLDLFENKVISINSIRNAGGINLNSSSLIQPREDKIFEALLGTSLKNGMWTKRQTLSYCTDPAVGDDCDQTRRNINDKSPHTRDNEVGTQEAEDRKPEPPLDCGKSVNFTHYDHLVGVSNRRSHPSDVPEPHASLVFRHSDAVDLHQLEKKLRRSKREKPKSLQLYNQIGNFWRMKGDASKAIECFRRSLAVSPNNAEVLLNLARVLFSLQYLDDAIFLTRRSLEVQPPDQNAWLQHFTLGEILKEYGNYQEAEMHLRHTLELRPHFQPAEAALQQLESAPGTQLHGYTVFIIIVLVVCVLCSILSTLESAATGEGSTDGSRLGRVGTRALRARCRRPV